MPVIRPHAAAGARSRVFVTHGYSGATAKDDLPGQSRSGYGHASTLWSMSTSRDIVEVIVGDAHAGRLARGARRAHRPGVAARRLRPQLVSSPIGCRRRPRPDRVPKDVSDHDPRATPVRPVESPFHPHDADDNLRLSALEHDEQTASNAEADQPAVVVGIDGSDESKAALHWAIRYAQRIGVAVRAVAVWHQPIQFAGTMPMPAREFQDEAQKWLTDVLPDLASDEPGASLRTLTEEGDPATVLVHHARHAQLLVLGNHGRGALAGALIGSVAQRCVHHSRSPVVLVPRQPTPA